MRPLPRFNPPNDVSRKSASSRCATRSEDEDEEGGKIYREWIAKSKSIQTLGASRRMKICVSGGKGELEWDKYVRRQRSAMGSKIISNPDIATWRFREIAKYGARVPVMENGRLQNGRLIATSRNVRGYICNRAHPMPVGDKTLFGDLNIRPNSKLLPRGGNRFRLLWALWV